MKIGIFVHSQSGNTSKLALAVTQKLREKGQDVSVELLRPIHKVKPRMRKVALKDVPDTTEYDVVLIGGPIWGFAPSPVAMSFINKINSLKGKKAMSFSTSFFPTVLSNAKSAHKKIQSSFEDLGAEVLKSTAVPWGFYCGKKRMDEAVEEICGTVLGK